MKRTRLFACAVAAVAGVAQPGIAAILAIGAGSATTMPTSVPTIFVGEGGTLTFSVWARGEGSGYLQAASFGVFQSTSSSWAGGTVSATSALPASAVLSGATSTYASTIADMFGLSVNAPNVSAVTGGSVVIANIGGTNITRPASPVTSAGGQLIATVKATVAMAPGTYYLYLARTGQGISEAPAFKAASFVGGLGSGAAVTQTSRFGFGDAAVATFGGGVNGTVANTLSSNADAIISVGFVDPPFLAIGAAASPTVVPGTGVSYTRTLIGGNGASFQMGGTEDPAGHTLVAFDFSGAADYGNFFAAGLPSGATQLTGTALLADLALFNQLGGSYDVVVDLGSVASGSVNIGGLGNGITLNAIAVVPEPSGPAGPAGLLGCAALTRGRAFRRGHG